MPRKLIKCKRCRKKKYAYVQHVQGESPPEFCDSCDMYLHYAEEVHITELVKHDPRLNTPKLKAYLKKYAHRTDGKGRLIFYRAAMEKAWFDLPLAAREKRCRENYLLSSRRCDDTMDPEATKVLADKKWEPLSS